MYLIISSVEFRMECSTMIPAIPVGLLAIKAAVAGGAAAGGGGLVAALATPEVIGGAIAALGGIGKSFIARQAALGAARWAVGAAVAPWLGAAVLAGGIMFGAYKILNAQADKGNKVDVDLDLANLRAKIKNEKFSAEEFSYLTRNKEVIDKFKEEGNKYKMENPSKNISEIYNEILKSFKNIAGFNDVNENDIKIFTSAITGYKYNR